MQDTDAPTPSPLYLSDPLENSSGGKWGPPGWGPDVWALTEVHRVCQGCAAWEGPGGFTEEVTWRIVGRVQRKRGGRGLSK